LSRVSSSAVSGRNSLRIRRCRCGPGSTLSARSGSGSRGHASSAPCSLGRSLEGSAGDL
jgi:hypothetical protein